MSTHASTGLYDEDLYCSNPNNLITAEIQTLQTPGIDDYYFLIPHAAPFYVETLRILNHQTGLEYTEGVDYIIGHYFVDAMRSLKRPIAGSIRLLRRDITGTVRIQYHTVGGQWGLDSHAILEELANKSINPIIRSWEQIDVLPQKFPAIAHDQPVDKLVGSDDIVEAIDRIGNILEASAAGTSESHINDRNNPHQVNKNQVGLDQVANYAPATLAQAVNVVHSTSYITPLTLHHALDQRIIPVLDDHIADRDNPHGTTKAHVGLGSVPDLPLANSAQAVDPLNNSAFMSPYTTALMMEAYTQTGALDDLTDILNAFMARRDNPHNVTASQVGTLTTAEIQALIISAGSGEAITFNGYTFEQFMDLVVEETEMVDILQQMAQAYGSHNADLTPIGTVELAAITATNLDRDDNLPVDVFAGVGGYVVVNGENVGTFHSVHDQYLSTPVVRDVNSLSFHAELGYGIANNGGVIALVEGSPEVENTYNGDHPSFDEVNAAQAVYTTQTARWIHTEDDRLVRSTGPADAQVIATEVEEIWLNTEYKKSGEFVVYQTNAGFFAAGNAGFVTAFNNWKTQVGTTVLEQISEFAITDDHVTVRRADGQQTGIVEAISIDRNDTQISFGSPVALSSDAMSISGNGAHVAVLDNSGKLSFIGDLEGAEEDIDGEYVAVAAGGGFTVLLDRFGFVEFWGDSPNNHLHYNERWEMKDA